MNDLILQSLHQKEIFQGWRLRILKKVDIITRQNVLGKLTYNLDKTCNKETR